MEFLIGAFCGALVTALVILKWVRPKPLPIKYVTKCERSGCDFVLYMHDYPTMQYIADLHEAWHKEQEQFNAGS